MSNNPVLDATARLARAHNRHRYDAQEIRAAKQAVTEAKLRRAVEEALMAEPPLEPEAIVAIAQEMLKAAGR